MRRACKQIKSSNSELTFLFLFVFDLTLRHGCRVFCQLERTMNGSNNLTVSFVWFDTDVKLTPGVNLTSFLHFAEFWNRKRPKIFVSLLQSRNEKIPAKDAKCWDAAKYLEIPDFDEFANIESFHLDGFCSHFSFFCLYIMKLLSYVLDLPYHCWSIIFQLTRTISFMRIKTTKLWLIRLVKMHWSLLSKKPFKIVLLIASFIQSLLLNRVKWNPN